MATPREAQLLSISNIMASEGGRDFMWRYLQQSYVFVSVFDVDPIQHAYNAGRREVGLFLQREVKEAAPDQYIMMIKEHIDD